MKFAGLFVAALLALAPAAARAQGLETVKVADGVFAFVGETGQRSPENFGNNATFGLIVTPQGAVLIDPGGSWKGAQALHDAVRKVTDQPVRVVVDTGGQDHRWMGNGYWRAQGAKIIASRAAVEDQKARASMQMTMLTQLLGSALAGTQPAYADEVFDAERALDLGGTQILIRAAGPAHTPGDAFVWLPDRKTVFAGDIVFVDRLLGVLDFSRSKGWMAAFEAIAALAPDHVVPGHGRPTTLARARAQTYDYLALLRERVGAYAKAGGDIIGAPKIDQSAYRDLPGFEDLAGRNAQAVFSEMEFE